MTNDRIALITPWPPQHSGIADFSWDLAAGLVDAGHDVDVFTHTESPQKLVGVRVVQVSVNWPGHELGSYRYRLYQLGNNVDFHGWMLAALVNYPGVVQLHDIVLHHFFAGVTVAVGNPQGYRDAVLDWYGERGVAIAEEALRNTLPFWEKPEVLEMPLFEVFAQHATAILVHSRFAAMQVQRKLPEILVWGVKQTYRHEPPTAPRSTLRKIGLFGGVQTHKRIDWFLDACDSLGAALDGIEIVVVGGVAENCEPLVERSRTSSRATIRFTGRVSEEQFVSELESTDLCIALRYPTMGETSAVVMRALQKAVPTIVSDIGWYSELPGEVLKAPVEGTAHFLSSTIYKLITEPGEYRKWAGDCLTLLDKVDLSHAAMCEDIVNCLAEHRADQWLDDVVVSKLADMGFDGAPAERTVLGTFHRRTRLIDAPVAKMRPARPHASVPRPAAKP